MRGERDRSECIEEVIAREGSRSRRSSVRCRCQRCRRLWPLPPFALGSSRQCYRLLALPLLAPAALLLAPAEVAARTRGGSVRITPAATSAHGEELTDIQPNLPPETPSPTHLSKNVMVCLELPIPPCAQRAFAAPKCSRSIVKEIPA